MIEACTLNVNMVLECIKIELLYLLYLYLLYPKKKKSRDSQITPHSPTEFRTKPPMSSNPVNTPDWQSWNLDIYNLHIMYGRFVFSDGVRFTVYLVTIMQMKKSQYIHFVFICVSPLNLKQSWTAHQLKRVALYTINGLHTIIWHTVSVDWVVRRLKMILFPISLASRLYANLISW